MSSEIAIKVENLSKCYHIYEKPRDRLAQMFFWGRKKFYREFWALKDVSFEIKKGETVGIIGRNGSGKSTLLQLICGTLAQTTGGILSDGRVAALLELGSGFNPQFTGHENILLNASILGLKNDEISSVYQDIVDFADIDEHIHQPVKTYSSGMMVRLAFSVIAHVKADILIIDEALAVGDAIFTQKCMRFIRKFRENGTLLFVSHDMRSVASLCDKVIWLDKGEIQEFGETKQTTESYLQYTNQLSYGSKVQLKSIQPKISDGASSQTRNTVQPAINSISPYKSEYDVLDNLEASSGWQGDGGVIDRVAIVNSTDPESTIFKGGERVTLIIEANIFKTMENPILGFLLRDRLGQTLFGENTLPFSEKTSVVANKGSRIRAEFDFSLPMLPNGDYVVMASLADGDLYNNIQHHWLHDALVIHVHNSMIRWGLVGISFYDVKLESIQ